MKKLLSFLLAVGLFIFVVNQTALAADHANRIISSFSVKGGYLIPGGTLDGYNNSASGGVALMTHPFFLEYGFLMVGADIFEVKKDENKSLGTDGSAINVTGLHFDLCWHLIDSTAFCMFGPYLGVGPAYNIYSKDDPGLGFGLDMFVGLNMNLLCNHRSILSFEVRYKQLEFRENRRALNISVGFWYFLDDMLPN